MQRTDVGTKTLTRRAALLLTMSVVTGCGLTQPADEGEGVMELTSGKAIDDAIGPLWEGGGERALADVVDVEFDEPVSYTHLTLPTILLV